MFSSFNKQYEIFAPKDSYFFFSGTGSSLVEGLAFQKSPHGKIRALYRTVSGNGDIRILGACRRKPTAGSEMGRDRCLIKPDQ